jgi:hypothetical protein
MGTPAGPAIETLGAFGARALVVRLLGGLVTLLG